MFNSPLRVSLGIPVYKGETFLEDCLESLPKQSLTDFEIVIRDKLNECLFFILKS